MAKYATLLRDPRWQRKRLEILERDNFTCQHCKDKETELHVHHEKYTGKPWEVPSQSLMTLCKFCHRVEEETKKIDWLVGELKGTCKLKHHGGFIIARLYLNKYAFFYFDFDGEYNGLEMYEYEFVEGLSEFHNKMK